VAGALARRFRGGIPVVLLRKESGWDDCSVGPLARYIGSCKVSESLVSYNLTIPRGRPQQERPRLSNFSARNYTKHAKLVGVIVHMVMPVNWTKPGIFTMGYVRFDGWLETLTGVIRSLNELINNYFHLPLWIFNTSRQVCLRPKILSLPFLVRSSCSCGTRHPKIISRELSSKSPHHQDCKFCFEINCYYIETATKTPFAQG